MSDVYNDRSFRAVWAAYHVLPGEKLLKELGCFQNENSERLHDAKIDRFFPDVYEDRHSSACVTLQQGLGYSQIDSEILKTSRRGNTLTAPSRSFIYLPATSNIRAWPAFRVPARVWWRSLRHFAF